MEKQTFDEAVTPLPLTMQASIRKVRVSDTIMNYVLLVASLIVGAGLRLWQIDRLGFNADEAVYSGQAAAIARLSPLKDLFPVFRAHPLLLQTILAWVFQQYGVSDYLARLVAVGFGVATVVLVYLLGNLLYGQRAGVLAALFMALMPYPVIVSRQVLLDGPQLFFTTLTFFLLAKFAMTERPIWFYMTGIGMGLTFLAKETGVVLLGSIYAFLALSREIRIRILDVALSLISMLLVIAVYPLSLWLGGGTRTGQSYLIWQLLRQPNHDWNFYAITVPAAIGYLVIIVGLIGLWLLRREKSWREGFLVWWIIVPVAFFEVWPTKGFQYLLPIAPAFAILAARTLARWSPPDNIRSSFWRVIRAGANPLVACLITFSLFFTSLQWIGPSTSTAFLAGTGGVPGGREAGLWVLAHAPKGATFVTIGPSMANIVRFYGQRKAYGLSVSPNPSFRNPSYVPVVNPDLQIRYGDIQYLVWDSFSAQRSAFFSDMLLNLSKRFHGRVIHTESIPVSLPDGTTIQKPVIIIYGVRP
jgi:hypothetical protein